VSEIGSSLYWKPIGVQGAWRREGRRAGRREIMGERARAAIKSRGCGDLGGQRLEKRNGRCAGMVYYGSCAAGDG
jgi:hypothetical protein